MGKKIKIKQKVKCDKCGAFFVERTEDGNIRFNSSKCKNIVVNPMYISFKSKCECNVGKEYKYFM